MKTYLLLNKAIDYIEDNLEDEIEYKKIAQILGMNENTAQTAFYILCDITIAEYIRKRRLSKAGYDLYNNDEKIIDISTKYQYTSATAFSRAFENFHGIKPSKVKNNPNGLKVFPRLKFQEDESEKSNIEYSIEEKESFVLYGIGMKTTLLNIQNDAPKFWETDTSIKYMEKYGRFNYGMTVYTNRWNSNECEYWILYDKNIDEKNFKKIVIPKGRWLVFKINSQESKDVQSITQRFYNEFVQSTNYRIAEVPELEYYHDGITEFMVPIN